MPSKPNFHKLHQLPPYVFAEVEQLKLQARQAGEDIIDLGMGNPNLATPQHIVDKICETAQNPRTHRYSSSRGIPNLRAAICDWYAHHFDVSLDAESEAIALIGSKEGLAHFVLMTIGPGDRVICADPAYPIHQYSVVIAGGELHTAALLSLDSFLSKLEVMIPRIRPKLLILSFPNNPTTLVADEAFFARIIKLARDHEVMVLHDFAYAEICFDAYRPPSMLQLPGARDVAIEFTSLSKSHAMAGWRVGFACGNARMIHALTRMKSYLDYGIPTPIQVGAIEALRGPQGFVAEHVLTYQERRDALVNGLAAQGPGQWMIGSGTLDKGTIEKPKATMFVWAKIPAPFEAMNAMEFSRLLLQEAQVAVSPGNGFGEAGEGYVRFALVENRHRIRQAVRNIRRVLRKKTAD